MRNIITASALGLVMTAPGMALAATVELDSVELENLRRQVAMVPLLLERVEQLEKANAASQSQAAPTVAALETRVAAVEESNDKQTDQLAQGLASANAMDWARNIKWKGDIRYRHEQFDVEDVPSDRYRHRIRARLGMEAKISNTLLAGFQIASGDANDPRSTNSTYTDANQRKTIGLDLAYVDWKPREGSLFTVGKQKQPWFKPGTSLFFDGDVNPEGLAYQYGGKTGPFAKAWAYWLAERSTSADSNVIGAQVGYVVGGFTIAAGYWDYGSIQDDPILNFNGAPAGNSTYASNATCTVAIPAGTTRCYTFDYDIAQADLQWTGMVGGRPITLFGGYLENMDPDTKNSGYTLGFLFGKAGDAQTWEFGAMYEDMERDAQFAAFVDSDFADGLTQGKGYVLQGAWAPVKNMTIKATYFLNDRNYDGAIVFPVATEADYKRLQLDLNYKF